MALFLSSTTNKVDRKGRVSVPSAYRAILKDQGYNSVVCYPSFALPAIECCDIARMERLSASLDQLNPFADDRSAFATSILADSSELAFDPEGRIVLPELLLEHSGIQEAATFVGQGATFQIWEPEAYRAFRAAAREQARAQRESFRWQAPATAGDGA